MIHDHLDNASLYALGSRWEQAIAFLRTLNADTPDGEYPLDGDRLYARVMSYQTKEPQAGVLESHRRYADIQVCLCGAEGIDLFDAEALVVRTPYAEQKDATFYEMEPATRLGRIDVHPGYFVYLLPRDAHRPAMAVGSPHPIKKAVVKVALD